MTAPIGPVPAGPEPTDAVPTGDAPSGSGPAASAPGGSAPGESGPAPLDDGARAAIAAFGPRVRAVAFDVDGTLTGLDHMVTAGNLAALRRLDEAGLTVIVVTGRALESASATLTDAGLHGYVAAVNGSLVVDIATGERVRTRTLEPAASRAFLDYAEKAGLVRAVFTAERIVLSDPGPGDEYLEYIDVANQGSDVSVGDPEAVDPAEILKLMAAAPADVLDAATAAMTEALPRVERSMPMWMEYCSAEAGKWNALEEILRRLGIDPADVAGVGDAGNDLGWLVRIGLSAATGNARDEVKEVTDIVVGNSHEDGAAQFVDALLAARGPSAATSAAEANARGAGEGGAGGPDGVEGARGAQGAR